MPRAPPPPAPIRDSASATKSYLRRRFEAPPVCPRRASRRILVNKMFPSAAVGAIGAVAFAGLAAGGFAYASRWPGSRIFGQALIVPSRPGELALTFDDGPSLAWTPRLLDTLAEHKVRATFFLLGERAQAAPELVRRIVNSGHLTGNHSWSHPDLSRSSLSRIRDELARTQDTLAQIAGEPVRFFRPPFGARRPAVFRIARELGLRPVLWNAMTSDWSEPSADRITSDLASKIDDLHRRGRAANIVLHDGGHRDANANRAPSIAAAAALLARYARSHRFVTLDAWA
jgi:peptidoglycan-N-acetylglucosamine deacetylase